MKPFGPAPSPVPFATFNPLRIIISGAVLLLITALFLGLRTFVFHGWITEAGSRTWQFPSGIERYILPVALLGRYAALVAAPVQLFADYRWLPAHMHGAILAAYCLLGIISVVAAAFLIRKRPTRPAGIGAFWFLCAMLPFLQILYVQSFFAERHVSLALAGAGLCLGGALQSAWSRWIHSNRQWPIMQSKAWIGIWLVMLAAQSWARVGDWQSGEKLWFDQVRHAPDSAFGLHNLAWFELQDGKLAQSKIHLDRALKIDPNYSDAWRTRGDLFMREKQWASARSASEKASRLIPSDAASIAGQALAAYAENKPEEARKLFHQAALLDPAIQTRFQSIIQTLR
jgi:tetratricopeptide (TPR) repeat protein